jgi:hypothetical protein
MIQELIDAVNAYRLEHSKCEASGHRTSELNDTYVKMLLVCDAAEHSVQADALPGSACCEYFRKTGYLHSEGCTNYVRR